MRRQQLIALGAFLLGCLAAGAADLTAKRAAAPEVTGTRYH